MHTQAADIDYENTDWFDGLKEKVRLFLPIQRWLWRCGSGLLQLQCNTSFTRWEG
jgi:hypothetical protein